MKASIVVRTYNSEATIGRVLEGIFSQGFRDFELVVVDSGSTDGTHEIVSKYPHEYVDYSRERFTYSGSLNAGIAAASGEYAVCLSHHCVPLHEDWLGSLVEAMDSYPQLAGVWGPLVFDVGEYPVGKEGLEVMDLEGFRKKPNHGLQNPNSIIRRALWEERPFSMTAERCEDQDWAFHFLELGYRTAQVRHAPVLYAPEFGFYAYALNNYRNSLALDRMFGFRGWEISTKGLIKTSVRLAGATLAGKRSPRTLRLGVSSAIGRWIAGKRIQLFGDSGAQFFRVEDGKLLKGKALATGIRSRLKEIESAAAGRRFSPTHGDEPSADLDRKTRFFLVGEMRSGTSWLSSTLNAHQEIFCKGEGSFFGRDQTEEEIPVYKGRTPSLHGALAGCEDLRTWHSLSWNAWARGEAEEDIRNVTRLATDYFLTKESAVTGKKIIGDKSPLHTDHVDEIAGIYPDAKVIHIYRDGRDVAVSLMHHFWRLAEDKGGPFELDPEELQKRDSYLADPESFHAAGDSIFTEERLRQMAARWSRRVTKASRDGRKDFGDGFYELRYEDLLAEPEKNLKSMLDLLGARSDPEAVSRCVEKTSFEKVARRSQGQEDAGSFFRKGVAGDWEGVFTPRDREIYEEVAGETLNKMGYEIG